MKAAGLALLLYLPSVAAAPPPAAWQLVLDELRAKEMIGPAPQDIHMIPAADGESYQAVVGTYLFQVSADAGFAMSSHLFEEYADQLNEAQRAMSRGQALKLLDERRMIVFPPNGNTQLPYSITVFTDVSCPFCAKFHEEVAELNQAGVKVRYLSFPRDGLFDVENGLATRCYRRTFSVWCNPDPHLALAEAMHGRSVPVATCDNPVAAFHELGESFGVRGTPAIVFENGDLWIGYYTAIDVLEYLGNHYFPPRCEEIE
jgi:thiol:disulfide interchange protein DsbC